MIFIARVADVSLGTFRTIVVFRGKKILASLIGFFEISIWLLAASQVFTNLDQWNCGLAYAGGFAVGNYVGISIEGKFSIGDELIRCISFNRDVLADKIRSKGFKVVSFDDDMSDAIPVELLLIIEKRGKIPSLIQLIRELDQTAVFSISDVKSVYEGFNLVPHRSFLNGVFMPSGKRR
ncbi:MAG: hypothetical protein ACI9XK_003157 [Granulosicoccus sp.]